VGRREDHARYTFLLFSYLGRKTEDAVRQLGMNQAFTLALLQHSARDLKRKSA
jgi:hypothetical protein